MGIVEGSISMMSPVDFIILFYFFGLKQDTCILLQVCRLDVPHRLAGLESKYQQGCTSS